MDPAERKRLLVMAQARARPGAGSALHAVREARANFGWEGSLPELGPIRFAIVGGLATARYMPQRMTLDTDILIAVGDLIEVERVLSASGCRRDGPLTIGGSSWRLPGGRLLDVLALDRVWVPEALATACPDEAGRPYIALAYLVLMKLESGRLQDLADIGRMLGLATEAQLHETRRIVTQHRPQDGEDLESMIRLGKLEHEAR